MFAPPMIHVGQDRPEGPSCAGVFMAAARPQVVPRLASLGFSGWVGPQQGRWVLAVAENPHGPVAAGKRTIDGLGREVAVALGTVVLAARIRRDEALGLWLFDGADEVAVVDTGDDDGVTAVLGESGDTMSAGFVLDEFGEPVPPAGADPLGAGDGVGAGEGDDEPTYAPLARVLGCPAAAEEVTELLVRERSEDESESERFTALAKLTDLPTWLVSASVLPKEIWGGPARSELTRMHLGRTGPGGTVLGFLARRTTRRPPRNPEP